MSEQLFIFNCPACGTSLQMPRHLEGGSGPCPECQETITSPGMKPVEKDSHSSSLSENDNVAPKNAWDSPEELKETPEETKTHTPNLKRKSKYSSALKTLLNLCVILAVIGLIFIFVKPLDKKVETLPVHTEDPPAPTPVPTRATGNTNLPKEPEIEPVLINLPKNRLKNTPLESQTKTQDTKKIAEEKTQEEAIPELVIPEAPSATELQPTLPQKPHKRKPL